MRDFGRSDDQRVQAQLDRLGQLSLPQGRLGLETIRALLIRLGNPQLRLPPVFHVAGTNGKGSTCAFLRAMLEAEGYKVHATISPHLVRYNERIRLAGELISDEMLAELLEEVLDAGEDLHLSFFEVTIAAAFLAFSRVPADACVVEVGLGGRFDATNVIEQPAVCGIAALGLDHERFLLAPEEGTPQEPMARIAFEKAGIAKKGVPLVTIPQPELEMQAISEVAARVGAPLSVAAPLGEIKLGLPGAHQAINAALAVAMLEHQNAIAVSSQSVCNGLAQAKWPARLQYLADGPLTKTNPGYRWLLDGGHNAQAAEALAQHFATNRKLCASGMATPRHAILGMLEAKDWRGFIDRIAPFLSTLVAVPVPGHDCAPPLDIAAYAHSRGVRAVGTAETVRGAADWLKRTDRPGDSLSGEIFVGGSLYLAGEVLRMNGEIPD